jgi:hypothetical protein
MMRRRTPDAVTDGYGEDLEDEFDALDEPWGEHEDDALAYALATEDED